jgi:hypothetical protein
MMSWRVSRPSSMPTCREGVRASGEEARGEMRVGSGGCRLRHIGWPRQCSRDRRQLPTPPAPIAWAPCPACCPTHLLHDVEAVCHHLGVSIPRQQRLHAVQQPPHAQPRRILVVALQHSHHRGLTHIGVRVAQPGVNRLELQGGGGREVFMWGSDVHGVNGKSFK